MDIRKLQRAIVDGLEDVKGQNIVVFNTEHLSALFERVVIASGTSNRQTKALAASVRDAVKTKGFGPTRTEGEENGEWIIVDCGAAVVHLMQPGIREYYHLEEIWGDKPVKLKLDVVAPRLVKASEPEPAVKAKRPAAKKVAASKSPPTKEVAKKSPAKKAVAKKAPAKKAPARPAAPVKKAVTRTVGTKSGAAPAKAGAGRRTPAGQVSRDGEQSGPPQGMKLWLVAVGQRQPAWADTAYQEFAKRFPPELRLKLKACKAEPRGGRTAAQLMAAEALRIEAAIPRGVRRVVLDERGDRLGTQQLAARLSAWKGDGRDVALIVGGPDGLDPALKATAAETLRLSDLTLPHAFVRVLLAEALYRAWSVTVNHPYHRE